MILRSKPQDVEYDQGRLGIVVLLYLISGIYVLGLSTQMDIAVGSMLLDIVVLISFIAGCLALLKLKARLVQTLTALVGTGVIFHCLAWPIIDQLSMSDVSESDKSTLSLVFLMLLSWQILVNAHIYRHALSVDMTKAMVLSIAYWLMSMTLSQIIFPAA